MTPFIFKYIFIYTICYILHTHRPSGKSLDIRMYQNLNNSDLLAEQFLVVGFFFHSRIFSNFSSMLFITHGIRISGEKNQDGSLILFLPPLVSINVCVCL